MEKLIVFATVCSTLIGMCLCFIGFQVAHLLTLKRSHNFQHTVGRQGYEMPPPRQNFERGFGGGDDLGMYRYIDADGDADNGDSITVELR